MSSVLEITNLCKKYPSFELKDVSFTMNEGSIMGFIGRNGAGKTTTIKSILNFVHPSSGSIKFFGKEMSENEDEIKQLTGYAPGGINYYPMKTLKKITKITKSFYPEWNDELYRKYMTAFKLDENKKPKELSEGMKVKYNLVLALSHGAKLLILDEPTSGLDPVSRDELLTIFEKLRDKGTSILFSTHITSDLEKCADSITYIKQGQIVDSAAKEDFIRNQGGGTLEEIMVHLEKEEINI